MIHMKLLLSNIVILILVILTRLAVVICKKEKKKSVQELKVQSSSSSSSSSSSITLSSGLKLRFTDKNKEINSLLSSWAKELEKKGLTLTYNEAVNREQIIVSLVQSGKASLQTYHEYQRMAAGVGVVDSARLMMEYGIQLSITEISNSKNKIVKKLFEAASNCNIEVIKSMINDKVYIDLYSDDGMTPLIVSSYSGCYHVVEFLISEGANVETFGSNGINPVMAASLQGHEKIVELLHKKGNADINAKHKFVGTTPLHMASELGRISTIIKLCDLGADVYVRTAIGGTILHAAAHVGVEDQMNKNGTIDTIVQYCKFDVDTLMNDDTTALYLSSQFGHVNTTIALLQNGANVNFAMPIKKYEGEKFLTSLDGRESHNSIGVNSERSNGASIIHVASEEGHYKIVQTLLNFGANINSKTIGVTPIHLAVQYNRSEVVDILIKNNANLNEQSLLDGGTPLYHACGKGLINIMEKLLQAGADPHLRQTRSDGFPLLYATISGQFDAVKTLLKYNVDVSMSSKTGLFPLGAAAANGDLAILKLLLVHGANPFAITKDGFTIYHMLTLSKNYLKSEIMRKLFNHLNSLNVNNGILLNMVDNEGNSVLHYSVSQQDLKLTKNFIEMGVNLEIENNDGATIIYLASSLGNYEIVRELIIAGSNVNTVIKEGKVSPLLAAIDRNHLKVVNLLLTGYTESELSITSDFLNVERKNSQLNKADPNQGALKKGLQMPIVTAVIQGKAVIAKVLLENGAHCNIIIGNSNDVNGGETLIEIAKRKRDYDMLQVLSSFPDCDPEIIRKS